MLQRSPHTDQPHIQWSEAQADREERLRRLGRMMLYLVLITTAMTVVSPFVYMLSTSLTPAAEVFSWPPKLIPSRFEWSNYREALVQLDFGRYFINSLIVTVASTISAVVLDALAGYAFGKMRFPGRDFLFFLVLISIMIPIQITMVPTFIMFRHFPLVGGNNLFGAGGTGLVNTYTGLILPGMATTFGTYLIREHFRALPWDLLDAARIDGLSEFKIFSKIFLPLAKPALAAAGIFSFTETWNSFVWPLILVTEPEMRTLQLGLSLFRGQYFTDWHLMMAAVVVTALPNFVIFILGQRLFVKGMAVSGLKG